MKIPDSKIEISGMPKTAGDVAFTFVTGVLQLATWALLIGGCLVCNGWRP